LKDSLQFGLPETGNSAGCRDKLRFVATFETGKQSVCPARIVATD